MAILRPSLRILLVSLATSTPVAAQNIQFAQVPAKQGIDFDLLPYDPLPFTHRPGISVGDIDSDGWLDICICGGQNPRPQFFRNRGTAQPATGSLEQAPLPSRWQT